jgi:hypothetical protein
VLLIAPLVAVAIQGVHIMNMKWLWIVLTVLTASALAGCFLFPAGSNEKAITSFGFFVADNPPLPFDYTGVISGPDIVMGMPFYEFRSSLVAAFTSTGASVTVDDVPQVSGETENNFETPHWYTVTAEDGTTQKYLVDASPAWKATASDAEDNDYFSDSVALNGDYAIVGAPAEDEKGIGAGAAYIFHRTETNGWDEGTKLVASDAQEGDSFGSSVSISGDYVIVGAPGEDTGGTDAGAAYVFHRTGTNGWDTGTKLSASVPHAEDWYGHSVSIDGDYAVVGATGDDTKASSAGAAYVFRRTGTNSWDAGVKLMPTDVGGNFGSSVSLNGDYIIVGDYYGSTASDYAGSAYVFYRTGINIWDAEMILVAPDAQAYAQFGGSVSLSGDYAIVGAEGEDTTGEYSGSAYVFHRTGINTWDAGVELSYPNPAAGERFGTAVSISGDHAIVTARWKNAWVNQEGVAYCFERTGVNSWDAQVMLLPVDAEGWLPYGSCASMDGEYAIVGAPDGGAGNQGSAYIYH